MKQKLQLLRQGVVEQSPSLCRKPLSGFTSFAQRLLLFLTVLVMGSNLAWGADIVWDFTSYTSKSSFTQDSDNSITATSGTGMLHYYAGKSDAIDNNSGYCLKINGAGSTSSRYFYVDITGNGTLKIVNQTAQNNAPSYCVSGTTKPTSGYTSVSASGTNDNEYVITISEYASGTKSRIWFYFPTKSYIESISWTTGSTPTPSSECKMLSAYYVPSEGDNIDGVLDEANNKFTITVPYDAPTSGLSIKFTASAGVTAYLKSSKTDEDKITPEDGVYSLTKKLEGASNAQNVYFTAEDGTTTDQWRIEIVRGAAPTPSGYTITFNSNGGSGSMSAQEITGTAALTANTFTRASYAFVGWNTAAVGTGTDYTDGQSVTPTGDMTLYAQWMRFSPGGSQNLDVTLGTNKSYLYGFDTTKSLGTSNSDFTVSSANNGIATAAVSTFDSANKRQNFSITGVKAGQVDITFGYKGKDGTLYTPKSDTQTFTVYATITYDTNGGDAIAADSKYTTYSLPTPTKAGNTFDGWYSDQALTQLVGAAGANYTPTVNTTLYAKWTADAPAGDFAVISTDYTFALTSDLVDGQFYEGNRFKSIGGSPYKSDKGGIQIKDSRQVAFKVNAGAKITVAFNENSPREMQLGTTSKGKDLAHSATSPLSVTAPQAGLIYLSASSDLYASEIQVTYGTTYSVTYNAGGATGTVPTQSALSDGDKFTVAAPTNLTKSGYQFTGWNDGVNTYQAGDTYTVGTSNVTLTAQWAAKPSMPTVSPESGSEVTVGSKINITLPAATGKFYAKWDGDASKTASDIAVSANEKTVTKIGVTAEVINSVGTRYLYIIYEDANGIQSDMLVATYTVKEAPKYTVTFNNGSHGTCATASATQANAGDAVSLPAVTPNNGYTFNGWYTDASAGTKVGDAGAAYIPTANITVYAQYSEVAVSSISVAPASLEIAVGNSETLVATVLPANALNKTVTWTSSNEAAATVVDGVVTAVATGTATITARTSNGIEATCGVTVVSAAENYNVTVRTDNSGNGTVKAIYTETKEEFPIGEQTSVEADTELTITATPNEGYKFVGWGTATSSKNNPLTIAIKDGKTFTATFAALEKPTFTAQPVNATYTQNATATALSATAAASNGGSLSYRWYTCNEYGSNMVVIPNQTKNTYTPATTEIGTSYYVCQVTEKTSTGDMTAESNVVTITVTADKGDIVAEATTWDYTSAAPPKSKDNKLYYGDIITSGAMGVKMNSNGYAYFQKEAEAGVLTIVYGPRNSGELSLDVYANTTQSKTLSGDATLVATTGLCAASGLTIESVPLTADQNYVYIKRNAGAEGVIRKMIWTPGTVASTVTGTATNGTMDIKSGDYHVNSGVKLVNGTNVTFTATPTDASYELVSWTGAASSTSTSVNTFATTVSGNVTVGAVFDTKTQDVSDLTKKKDPTAFTYGQTTTYTLTKGIDYTTSSDGAITYTSSAENVATVDEKGKITPKNAGVATITLTQAATPAYAGSSITFTVTVNKANPGLSLGGQTSVTVAVGETKRINVSTSSVEGEISIKTAADGTHAKSAYSNRVVTITGVAVGNTSVVIQQVASANYEAAEQTIDITVEAASRAKTTVLEVRGASISAGGYFTGSENTSSVAFGSNGTATGNKSEKSGISPATSVYRTSDCSSITITLNSTSASNIIAGVDLKNTKQNKITVSIQKPGEESPSYTKTSDEFVGLSGTVYRFDTGEIDAPIGSKVTFSFQYNDKEWKARSTNIYYFEVTGVGVLDAPTIEDNGDATGTITAPMGTVKYLAYDDEQSPAPSASTIMSTGTTATSAAIPFTKTKHIYAVAYESATDYSSVSYGVVKVDEAPVLTLSPSGTVMISKGDQKTVTVTAATMNGKNVLEDYTYTFLSSNGNVTVNPSTGEVTGVSAGDAVITVTATPKSGKGNNATATVTFRVPDPTMITPEFTFGAIQVDVNVGADFTKVANAYYVSDQGRYAKISKAYAIKYSSANTSIATVDQSSGKIHGVAEGVTTITATFTVSDDDFKSIYNDGIATITVKVQKAGSTPLTVQDQFSNQDVEISDGLTHTYQTPDALLVKAGETIIQKGFGSNNYFMTYESSDWGVATVDANGLVTVQNVGTTTITVAFVPVQTGVFADYAAKDFTYTVTVTDASRYVVKEGYGAGKNNVLTTINDPNNYVTMTFGGWKGAAGLPSTTDIHYTDAAGDDKVDYWANYDSGTEKDKGAKSDGCASDIDFPYAITAKSSGNPANENMENSARYNPDEHTQFSVPCRGAYLQFEPAVDGTIEVHILHNGVLDSKQLGRARTVREVFIIDEFANSLRATEYGKAGEAKNPKIGQKSSSESTTLTQQTWDDAVAMGFGDVTPGGPNKVIEKSHDGGYGYASLSKSPMFVKFKVMAGKKYYVFCNQSKLGFYGFKFQKDTEHETERIAAHLSIESEGVEHSIVNDGDGDMTVAEAMTKYDGKPAIIESFDRGTMKAGVWNTLVLPYSMSDVQVKQIFGDGVELLYVDGVSGSTIMMSHHFYKTIEAGRPCLIRPSKDVTSLATAGMVINGIDYSYVTIQNCVPMNYREGTTVTSKDYTFVASFDPMAVKKGDYYISTSNGAYRLYNGDGTTLNGFRGYLKLNEGSSVKTLNTSIRSFEEDIETGIDGILVDASGDMYIIEKSDKFFTIDGKCVKYNQLNKGVYIYKGKKVVID